MKVFCVYSDGKDRIELFSNGTGAALIDNEFYPITKENFDYFHDLSKKGADGAFIAAYFKMFGKTFDALCEAEGVENGCNQ